jgi:diguanylate cyclase (GGDEF)-like protein
VVARVGGDEFAILMRTVDAGDAVAVAQSVRDRLSGSEVSASIGVAVIDGALPAAEVMIRADHACYAAKANGGNRVELYRVS